MVSPLYRINKVVLKKYKYTIKSIRIFTILQELNGDPQFEKRCYKGIDYYLRFLLLYAAAKNNIMLRIIPACAIGTNFVSGVRYYLVKGSRRIKFL
jgi:hypothetical protein